jgi:fatty acid desaturase
MNRPESIFGYSLLGVWRTDLASYYRLASARREGVHVWIQLVSLVSFYLLLLYLSPTYTVLLLLPAWYFGQALALAENYLEHYGADPTDSKANSVSCYHPLYNFVWFNNGHHQEHHTSPRVHWTLIPAQRPANGHHRIVPLCHVTTLFQEPMPWSRGGDTSK